MAQTVVPFAAAERGLSDAVVDAVAKVVRGKRDVAFLALTAIVARGHVLFEDVPGVGKTTLARALARVLGMSFRRVQFTSDLMPSDLLGVNIYDREKNAFVFHPGPLFAHIVLADEINRTTPKTQSALLEAMSEGQVSLDNQTHALPDPFLVMATQNPREFHGTFPLPESQLDRFLLRLDIGYPDPATERELLMSGGTEDTLAALQPVVDGARLRSWQRLAHDVTLDPALADYVLALVEATRSSPLLELGVSTRGALALVRAARAAAVLDGRAYCIPEDVQRLAVAALAHRVMPKRSADPAEAALVVREIVEAVPVPV